MAFPVFLQKASGVSLIVTLVAVLTFAFSVFSASEAAAPETAAAS